MKFLTSRTIFHSTTSSSAASPSPYFLSSHCIFLYSSSIEEPQKRRGLSSSSSSSWRHHDEESRNVRVSVWWDFENCSLPAGVNVFRVAQRITSAVRSNGIKGPVTITAFGDVLQLSRSNQEALSSTGVCLNHIPQGGKNSADRSLLVDLLYWVSQNPPPAHLFLISGDRDFANILHRLRMNNYNILLASTESTPGVLCSAASIMWHWNPLVRGDNLTGKHFNQPPDGPYGSWYGHYKGLLEDPFSDMEQTACSRSEDLPEPGTDSKPRPVPKAFLSRIRQILNSYPRGINITELRSELAKSNVNMDKDFFGHKRFSRLLLSMPTILKLRPAGDGQIFVHGTRPKTSESMESNSREFTGPDINNGDQDNTVTAEVNGRYSAVTSDLNGESLSLPPDPPFKEEKPHLLGRKEIDAHRPMDHPTNMEEQDSLYEVGFFRRIWTMWFGHKNEGSNEKGNNIPEKCSATTECSKKKKSEENSSGSKTHYPNPFSASSLSSVNVTESVLDDKIAGDSGENGEISRPRTGLFNKIVGWCRLWKTIPNPDNASGQCGKELNQMNSQSENRVLFSKGFFWDEMDLFVHTLKGSVLISQSRTREHMAQKLQKEGPMVLNDLSKSDLLHFVDLLISEKKWVEEKPSQTFPFKLIRHARRWSPSHAPGSNGLSSIFSGNQSESNLQNLPEHEMKKGDQSQSQTGACSGESNKKPSVKPRHEILADCQKLVAEILEKHPEGFNMGSFKKLFVDRYDYILDHHMLGYQRLASLLQIMEGVKIEATYILPAGKASQDLGPETVLPYNLESNGTGKISNSDSELSDSERKDNDRDSVWEELGPISEINSNRNGTESGFNGKTKKEMTEQVDFDDDCLSDEEFSGSEEENPTLDGSEGQGKYKRNEEDSSLLQILDSWYNSKDDSASNGQSRNVDEPVDCSRMGPKPSGSSGVVAKSTSSVTNSGRRLKHLKNYSFVADPVGDNKEKLIDNILGSLKKSTETKMQG